jgi:hypothetical protein
MTENCDSENKVEGYFGTYGHRPELLPNDEAEKRGNEALQTLQKLRENPTKEASYKPTTGEVLGEMGSMLKDFRSSLSEPIKDVSKFFSSIIKVNLAPYFIPTTIYRLDAKLDDRKEEKIDNSNRWGDFVGLAGLSIQAAIYYSIVTSKGDSEVLEKGHPEVLLIPLATNLASGAYEFYRIARENVVKKTTKGLEKKVVEEKPEIQCGGKL